ncbi:3-hydroxybutyryl dehydrogenase [Fusarium globosum]|uniref:3-hydroxybutyryl dehydrogenase n=1 Tax=Fusarium globosum TaxID=78864 RepID=A0A8H5XNC8_9HYPO|nr:3-hydroxybutyryl dehydrogenase [Fusarium globosum]
MTSSTFLIALDVGLSNPVAGKSFRDIISQGEVLGISLDGKQVSTIMSDSHFLSLPDGVIYHPANQRLYMTNMGVPPLNDGSVISTRLDGTDLQIILSKGQIHTPKQIALDKDNERLYISDREGLRVMRCNLDGSGLETLIQTGDYKAPSDASDSTKWCVGIAVAPKRNAFYWTQKGPSKGAQGRIFCSRIDFEGERQAICLLDHLAEPIDLEIDQESNTLYWTDRGELPYGNTFNRVQLDESGLGLKKEAADDHTGLKHEIIVQNFDEAIGLARNPEDGRWFVSDMGGTIWSFDSDGGNKSVVFQDKRRSFTGIALVRE